MTCRDDEPSAGSEAVPPPAPSPSRRAMLGLGAALVASLSDGIRSSRAQETALVGDLPPEIDRIRKRGKLLVGMTNFVSPPFSFIPKDAPPGRETETMLGSDVKLMVAIASALDVRVETINTAPSFNGVVDLVTKGEVDLGVSKLSVTLSRAARLAFSDPYVALRHGILANRLAIARIAKGADLADVIQRRFEGSIGVIAGSSFVEITRQLFPKARIRELADWNAVVQAANDGAVDIAYRDELEIKRVMKLRPELALNLRSVLVKDRRDTIAVALPWQSTHLLRFVNLVISRSASTTANDLLDAYPEIFAL